MLVSARRDADAARRFFGKALSVLKVTSSEVVTDDEGKHTSSSWRYASGPACRKCAIPPSPTSTPTM